MGICKAYDVRGKYPLELDENWAFKIGSAFGKFLKGEKIVIGMDARESSPSIKESVIKGLCSEKKEVIDIGLCNTPMLYFAVIKWEVSGGIMISASHNPAEFNGIKMVKNEKGNILQIGKDSGMLEIEKLSKEIEIKEVVIQKENRNILDEYINHLFRKLEKKEGLKIVIDYGNGVGSLAAKPFFDKTDFEVYHLYDEPKPNFPNHEPNPHVKENFNDLIKEVKKRKADLGIFFDGDADRATPVDENGTELRGDILIGILALDILKTYSGEKIYYDLRCSKTLEKEIKKAGGIPVAMKVGNPYYKEKLIKEGGVLGAETSGHMMYKEHYCIDDGLYAMIKLINIILKSGKKLTELSLPFMKYYKTYEINIRTQNKEEKLNQIEEIYSKKEAKISKIDGITVEFDDWWFNVRSSNTEDLLRLNLEADTKELMEEKTKEVEEIIKG
ncbi:MAG: phosphomannomutase/phosphoglucomutase [Candidatus Aenigmarchaeota archaeon]|nr:phosphomannomutase/phosphoglucomutase [Candidatus Aenigmarchaeota archaeon]